MPLCGVPLWASAAHSIPPSHCDPELLLTPSTLSYVAVSHGQAGHISPPPLKGSWVPRSIRVTHAVGMGTCAWCHSAWWHC